MEKHWHSLEIKEVYAKLGSSPRGLSSEEAEERLSKYGFNELREVRRISALQIFINQFKSLFVLILIFAAVVSVLISISHGSEEFADAIVIAAIVIINAVVGFIQEYRSEKALEAMKRLTAPKARVLRDGEVQNIPARLVVPGDIVLLEEGDRIPADCRLIEASELRTDEAVLTGESTPVEKTTMVLDPETPLHDRRNMVFMGTHVVSGRGRGIVVATGMNTEFGKIAEQVQTIEFEEPPLKVKLDKFARRMAYLIAALCIAIFGLEVFRGDPLIESFMIAVALAVSAVPEGLPAITTITLALGAKEMAGRNAIVRRLASVETLGSTTFICSDKTGTLTRGEMTVRRIYLGSKTIEVTGVGYEPKGEFLVEGKPCKIDGSLRLALTAGALCCNAELRRDGDRWNIYGDPTEAALLVAAAKAGLWRRKLESEMPRIREIPFSSERKRMTTVHKNPDGGFIAFMKGAPEIVVSLCSRRLVDGELKPLSDEDRRRILNINDEMASSGLRVLALAYRELEDPSLKEVESDMVFIGLVGMIDPPRREAIEAYRMCEKAGIRVAMITGDHKLTAIAVAKEIGMWKPGSMALTGSDLDKMSEEELEEIVEKVTVYARVSPIHKTKIVQALKNRGHIVAMTGDGVNDAPALKMADIGIAMGITGTDVTKEAADMVLADDNFATIVEAVKMGRVIYDNIRKFIRFLLACNFDEIFVITAAALANLPVPLTPAMILWINLLTDGPPAVALGMDPPDGDVMARRPRDPKAGIFHGMLLFVTVSFILQAIGTLGSFLISYFIYGDLLNEARTLAFMQATFFELIVIWNCRSEYRCFLRFKPWTNKYLVISVLVSVVINAVLPYIPLTRTLFHLEPLTLQDWGLVLGFASLGFLVLPEVFMRVEEFNR
ncbi:calcium-translocating P-type ATPase, SERCA-type [Candidatus Bathyarchaeota archaeon]|nr:MAG: calcium-translocating P-type ATPase, SERCA-type [Candidatus Bathyarchaeota archaeon]